MDTVSSLTLTPNKLFLSPGTPEGRPRDPVKVSSAPSESAMSWPCVSLFYLGKRHQFTEAHPWGVPVYTFRPNCNAGYAVLLTLSGAPVNIGEARGGLMAWTLCHGVCAWP